MTALIAAIIIADEWTIVAVAVDVDAMILIVAEGVAVAEVAVVEWISNRRRPMRLGDLRISAAVILGSAADRLMIAVVAEEWAVAEWIEICAAAAVDSVADIMTVVAAAEI